MPAQPKSAADRPRVLWLSTAICLAACAGCCADSARPGTHCGHCDYRFSYETPNPCDPCVCGVELPCFGHTPTSWQPWPEVCAVPQVVEALPGQALPQPLPSPGPQPAPPPTPPAEPLDPMSGRLPFDSGMATLPQPMHQPVITR